MVCRCLGPGSKQTTRRPAMGKKDKKKKEKKDKKEKSESFGCILWW